MIKASINNYPNSENIFKELIFFTFLDVAICFRGMISVVAISFERVLNPDSKKCVRIL